MPKYKITPRMLEEKGGIHRLERDGFSRERLHKEMYKITDGANVQERRNIMSKLYDRDNKQS